MKLSQRLKLGVNQDNLDFVDLEVGEDRRLFLNPRLIAQVKSPMAEACGYLIQSFFSSFITAIKNGDKELMGRILERTNEINEIHLGLSKKKSRGVGFGPKTKDTLVESLRHSEAVHTGLIEKIEDFALFVDGVGDDRLADMTGNVIRSELCKFTIEQCHKWNIETRPDVPLGYAWDPTKSDWVLMRGDGLVIDDSVYLLVPCSFVSRNNSFISDNFLKEDNVCKFMVERCLSFQDILKNVKRDANGEIIMTSEIQIELMKALGLSSKKQLANYLAEKKSDLLPEFRIETKDIPFTESEELDKKKQLAHELSDRLSSIKPGPEQFKDYERCICDIFSFVFKDDLSLPECQDRINEGSKIIDVSFSNTSSNNIFFDLGTKFLINAPIVFVECKNYGSDIGNPELDQMNGRLGKRGRFGIICCRKLANSKLFLEKEKDAFGNSGNMIICLTDKIILNLLSKSAATVGNNYDPIIRGLVETIYKG